MNNGKVNKRTGEIELMLGAAPKELYLSDEELRKKFKNTFIADSLIKLRERQRELERGGYFD
jgi:hypothetical protein